MKKVIISGLIAVLFSISAIANVNQKLSGSTQLFIAERDGRISLDMEIDGPTLPTRAPLLRARQVERVIAPAQVVNGVEMVSAFIHIDPNATAQIESMGVIVQERFKKFVVAMIPVDKIESVAQIAAVKQVNVARKTNLHTDMSRFYTNTLQVLDYNNAIASGLPCAFTGEGIVVGVIDTGIDFQHAMFMDADGNSRIKQAYVINDSGSFDSYTGETVYSLTTDNIGNSHGTHTATIAAGSDLTYNGINYGGMAPEADLVLVGLGADLYETYIAMGIKHVFDYADSQDKPAVCSISLGSMWGPHDGTGEMNEVFAEYAGDNPNHILVMSAGNEASYSANVGYVYVEGEASAESPFCTVINGTYNATTTLNLNRYYVGYECFYNRTPGQQMACKLHVVNTAANQILWTSDEITEFTIDDFSGINQYFTGLPEVYVYEDDFSGKYNVIVYTDGMAKKSGYTNPKYALAISIYPSEGGPCLIDGWEGYGYNLFANYKGTIDDYVFISGSDNSCINDYVATDDVISAGAYVSKSIFTDVDGNTQNYNAYYTLNDIAYFSSYQTSGHGPTGKAKPDICAPGALIVAGVNHYDTEEYMSADYRSDLVCDDPSHPLAAMQGTSMSAPCVAGIVALYLQAAQSVDKTLKTSDIRDIFAHSAITDEYTDQSNFGPYGKINALAGIKYILGSTVPVITTDLASITIKPTYTGYEGSQIIRIQATNLHSDLELSFSTSNSGFGLSKHTIKPEQAAAGVPVTVYFYPTTAGIKQTTLKIKSDGAETVSIPVKGTGIKSDGYIFASPTSLSFETPVGRPVSKTFKVTFTKPDGAVMISSVDNDGVTGSNNADGEECAMPALNNDNNVLNLASAIIPFDGTNNKNRLKDFIGPFEPVLIKRLVLELTGDDCFDITPSRINILSVPYSTMVTVTYHPDCAGEHDATIKINLLNGSAKPFILPLHGTATGLLNAPSFDNDGNNLIMQNETSINTLVNEMLMNSKVYAEGMNIIIESPVEQEAIVSDLSGRAQRVSLRSGRNEIPVNASGVYLVRIREKSTKLMLK